VKLRFFQQVHYMGVSEIKPKKDLMWHLAFVTVFVIGSCLLHCLFQHHHLCHCSLTSRWQPVFCQRCILWRSLKIFSHVSTPWFHRVGQRSSRNSSKGSIHSICTRSMAMLHYTPAHGVFSPTGLAELALANDKIRVKYAWLRSADTI